MINTWVNHSFPLTPTRCFSWYPLSHPLTGVFTFSIHITLLSRSIIREIRGDNPLSAFRRLRVVGLCKGSMRYYWLFVAIPVSNYTRLSPYYSPMDNFFPSIIEECIRFDSFFFQNEYANSRHPPFLLWQYQIS